MYHKSRTIFNLYPCIEVSKRLTAKNDVAATIGLPKIIDDLFQFQLPKQGLNLDARKKRELIDFLKCIPRIMEYAMKKEHMQHPFVEAGMTDKETGIFRHVSMAAVQSMRKMQHRLTK